MIDNGTTRREFIGTVTTSALAAGIGTTLPLTSAEAMPGAKPDMSWLNGVKGNHAQLFVTSRPGPIAFLHVANYIDTYKEAFGLSYPKVIAIMGLFGMAVPIAFNDAMWAKYGLGAATSVNDKVSNAAATTNVFAKPNSAGLMQVSAPFDVPGSATVQALRARKARFILCNNALTFWAMNIAAATKGSATTIKNDLLANMLPGIVVVPAMVIAVTQATEAGAAYMAND